MPKALRSSNHKISLTLMEIPENGPIHEYGVPVLKSAIPCTVKQVLLNERGKWVSKLSKTYTSCCVLIFIACDFSQYRKNISF